MPKLPNLNIPELLKLAEASEHKTTALFLQNKETDEYDYLATIEIFPEGKKIVVISEIKSIITI